MKRTRMMINKQAKDRLIFTGFFILILVFIGSMLYVTSGIFKTFRDKGAQCQANPLGFAITKLDDLNKDVFSCSCNSVSGKKFSVDEKGIYPEMNYRNDPVNWSTLIGSKG